MCPVTASRGTRSATIFTGRAAIPHRTHHVVWWREPPRDWVLFSLVVSTRELPDVSRFTLCCGGHLASPQARLPDRDPVCCRGLWRTCALLGGQAQSPRVLVRNSVPGAEPTPPAGAGRVPVAPSCEGTSLGFSSCFPGGTAGGSQTTTEAGRTECWWKVLPPSRKRQHL